MKIINSDGTVIALMTETEMQVMFDFVNNQFYEAESPEDKAAWTMYRALRDYRIMSGLDLS